MRLRKSFLIGKRDFWSAVLTKGFLFGLLAPAIFGMIGFGVVKLTQTGRVRRVAVVDHTGLGVDADMVQMATAMEAATKANPALGTFQASAFSFEQGSSVDRPAMSERVRSGELFGILDIDSMSRVVLHTSSGTGGMTFLQLTEAVNNGMRRARLVQSGIDPVRFTQVLIPIPLEVKSLTLTSDSGPKQDVIKAVVIPAVLMIMMAMIVLAGATSMLGSVAEDKKERVFEMLLASATPFEIIGGKVLASIGISLTSALVWVTCATVALYVKGMISLAPLELLPWFVAYLICEITMLSAQGAALGSATSSPRDAQQLVILLLGPVMLPLMMMVPLLDQPNGKLATILSFIPPFAPPVMMFRQAMPGGVPTWQPFVALAGVLLWTLASTWVASRIFRVGLLMQGKSPKLADLARWALRG